MGSFLEIAGIFGSLRIWMNPVGGTVALKAHGAAVSDYLLPVLQRSFAASLRLDASESM